MAEYFQAAFIAPVMKNELHHKSVTASRNLFKEVTALKLDSVATGDDVLLARCSRHHLGPMPRARDTLSLMPVQAGERVTLKALA